MEKKSRRGIYIIGCIFFIAIVILIVQSSKVKINESNYDDISNWDVQINDKVYQNVSLNDFMFPTTSKGDVVRMECNLPKDRLIKNPVIRFYSIHSVVEFIYKHHEIYEYGKDLNNDNKLLGYGYHFVNIPSDYAGSKLEIILTVTENDAFSNISVPQICNNDFMIRDFVIQNRLPLAINLFLIVFGILVTFISLVFYSKYKQFIKLICVGGFSIGIGFWSLCNYDLVMLYTYNLRVKSLIEYASFYIAPLFVMLFFWGDEFITRYKGTKTAYYIIVAAQVIFDLTAFSLQITGIVHFPAVLRGQHIILFALCFLVISQTIYDCIKKQLKKKILILGMTIMLIVGMLDMVHFLLEKYYMVSDDIHYTSIMCIGTMIFVLSQLADFGVGIGNIFLQGARTKILEQMAYVDEMTGLANRRKCEEIWDKLDDESSDYGIFSFDLNFLKKTNDTKGHAKGDLLIKTLADVLKNVFGDVGEVGRIGGDEYIVFIWDVKKADIEKHTHNLEEEIKKVNTENPELNLSTSYGFCSHNQYPELDSRHLYRKADALMYEMKLAMKAERKD